MSHIVTKSNCFIARWNIIPERKEEFVSIWEPLWNEHIDTMGMITNFAFFGWTRDPNVLVTIECYRDEMELAELRKSESFQILVARLMDCCSETVTIDLFSGIDADRSVFDLYPQGASKVHPAGRLVHAKFS